MEPENRISALLISAVRSKCLGAKVANDAGNDASEMAKYNSKDMGYTVHTLVILQLVP